MAVDEKTREALDLKKLQFPPRPPIDAIEVEPYENWYGEESLEVYVILNDSTCDDDLTGENVIQIKSAIAESLLDNGIRLFPYIRLIRQSDYREEQASL